MNRPKNFCLLLALSFSGCGPEDYVPPDGGGGQAQSTESGNAGSPEGMPPDQGVMASGSEGGIPGDQGGAAMQPPPAEDTLDLGGSSPEAATTSPSETDPLAPMATFPEAISCEGQNSTSCNEGSCCEQATVNARETLHVDFAHDAQVSPFALDRYEVTVGRFRSFVRAFEAWRNAGNPAVGAGEHPAIVASGWLQARDAFAVSRQELEEGVSCSPSQQTWTAEPGLNEVKPINCVSWYEAFAFCIWDGGRLPTELEWQYAAMGGNERRVHPWGDTPQQVSDPVAVYGCLGAGIGTGSVCSVDDILPVGSRPAGDGRFGHSDLVGSVFEWVLDWYGAFPETVPNNYARVDEGTERVLRGGGWINTMVDVLVTDDRSTRRPPEFRSPNTGVRCARNVDGTIY